MSPPDDGDNNAAANDSSTANGDNSANDSSTANERMSGIAQEEREALVAKRLQETLRQREGFTPRAQTAVPTGQPESTIAARLATVVMPRLAAPWPSPGAGDDGEEGWESPGWVVSRAAERAVAQCGVDPWAPALDAAAVGTLLAKLWQG